MKPKPKIKVRCSTCPYVFHLDNVMWAFEAWFECGMAPDRPVRLGCGCFFGLREFIATSYRKHDF